MDHDDLDRRGRARGAGRPRQPYHAAPLAQALAGIARVLPRLPGAYRSGAGVPYADYGSEVRKGIAAANRPMFLHELATAWLPAVPDIDQLDFSIRPTKAGRTCTCRESAANRLRAVILSRW
jgi:hypothetical protein